MFPELTDPADVASWDQATLLLRWVGADWNIDGDLFIYLDTRSGGTTVAYNPYAGSTTAITLPDQGSTMIADYLIHVEDGATAELRSWDGGPAGSTSPAGVVGRPDSVASAEHGVAAPGLPLDPPSRTTASAAPTPSRGGRRKNRRADQGCSTSVRPSNAGQQRFNSETIEPVVIPPAGTESLPRCRSRRSCESC